MVTLHYARLHHYSFLECIAKQPDGVHFTSAICLGAIIGRDVPPHAQDARILSMLMILRQVAAKHKAPFPMHIIAENNEDQTSSLAVVPSASAANKQQAEEGVRKSSEPDFINLQAIIARSLTMNLAYPQIQDAMSELLGATPYTPNITVRAPSFVCLFACVPVWLIVVCFGSAPAVCTF